MNFVEIQFSSQYLLIYHNTKSSLKIPYASPIPLPPKSNCLATTDFYCLCSFAFSGMSYHEITLYVIFTDWLLLVNDMYIRFIDVFSLLEDLCILSADSSYPFDEYTTVCLSIYSLKMILVAFSFGQL